VGVHLGITWRPSRHIIIPTLGATFAGTGGGYGATTRDDGLTFNPSEIGYFMTLDLIGFGLESRSGPITASASVRAGVDYFAVTGRLSDPQIDEDATGIRFALALRAEARVCGRTSHDSTARVCIFGGPTLLEGTHWMNGAVAGLGATF
jgi:hypothetical protein